MRSLPTAEYLWTRLDYYPETGDLIWKPIANPVWQEIAWNTQFAGRRAGKTNKHGHRHVYVDTRLYYAHRLIWVMMTGKWPASQIDHINGDRSDNGFSNLREATALQNQHNAKRRKDNTCGFKGVRQRPSGKFAAWIGDDYLGQFNTPEEAHAVRCEAARKLHGEFFNPG